MHSQKHPRNLIKPNSLLGRGGVVYTSAPPFYIGNNRQEKFTK